MPERHQPDARPGPGYRRIDFDDVDTELVAEAGSLS